MDQDSAHMVAASKVPMLKPGEYEIWRMRIEQYIQMIDYALWEVIENGATLPKTKIMEGVMTEMPITTAYIIFSRNMNTTQAQQKAFDDALVAPADRLEFEKCNMRLKTDIKPKEATFLVVMDAL
ncbi:hypothetical protein Tco_0206417 [Tanacetum coccineum]